MPTIVDVAVSAGKFNTLVQAVQAAGLVDALNGEGPFTVFAPTDEAFAQIPADTLQAVLNNKEQLTAILTYHVVPGKLMAADVVRSSQLQTLQGQSITVSTEGGVKVDDANVIQTDIEADNGVIHVIDRVMMPR
ncbi:MAG: fasciclin domain-containing protein [Armatimonadetes bacterium]|nr:fasciclin domain-containing protein [Armatimonadota bacterium]GIV13847.1 MAG: beta-Ig-H3/fasciclin [Fimbriimonadales bacterium]